MAFSVSMKCFGEVKLNVGLLDYLLKVMDHEVSLDPQNLKANLDCCELFSKSSITVALF